MLIRSDPGMRFLVPLICLWAAPVCSAEPPCRGDQLATAKEAMISAQAALDKSIAAVRNPQDSDLARLTTWFGVRSSAEADEVRTVLEKVRVFTDGATFQCAVRTDIAIGDAYAYVLPDNSFAIVLGAFFFNAKDAGFNSKAGILVHEMSHFTLAGATQDPAIYGTEEAKGLAKSNPAAARMNAENYEYFVESVAFDL